MFGDILMWALTVFGLIPMLKVLFGPKKTFQEELAGFSDDIDDVDSAGRHDDRLELDGHLSPVGVPDFDDAEPFLDDAEVTRYFQEIGECGDEYRRYRTRTGPR